MVDRYFSQKNAEEYFDEIMAYVENGDKVFITDAFGVPEVIMIRLSDFENLVNPGKDIIKSQR